MKVDAHAGRPLGIGWASGGSGSSFAAFENVPDAPYTALPLGTTLQLSEAETLLIDELRNWNRTPSSWMPAMPPRTNPTPQTQYIVEEKHLLIQDLVYQRNRLVNVVGQVSTAIILFITELVYS